MSKSKRVTMFDVAKAAGVSHQTVSRVINNQNRVAPDTRERVLRVIEDLNYTPSRVARSMAGKRTHTLAVITYDLSLYGPTQMVVNIEKAARSAGYDIVFANIDPADDDDIHAIANLVPGWSIDGAAVIAPVADHRYSKVIAALGQIPKIQIDVEPGLNIPSVIIAQQEGSYIVTRHLIELGHKHICEIRGPENWYGAVARHQGFLQAMEEASCQPVASAAGNWSAQSGYDAMEDLVKRADFTAVVAANDQMALGAISCLHAYGRRVPEDVAVAGYDDIPEAKFFYPPLTTIRQDFSALGQIGIEYLIELIEETNAGTGQRVIRPELIVRESTRPN